MKFKFQNLWKSMEKDDWQFHLFTVNWFSGAHGTLFAICILGFDFV